MGNIRKLTGSDRSFLERLGLGYIDLRSNTKSQGLPLPMEESKEKPVQAKEFKKQIRSALFQLQFELIIKRDACIYAIEEADFIASSGLVTRHSGHPKSKSGGNSVERRMIKRLHLKLEVGEDLEHVENCLATTNNVIDQLNRQYHNIHYHIFEHGYGHNSSFMKSNHGEDWKTKAEACIKMDRAEALRLKREFAKAKDTTSK